MHIKIYTYNEVVFVLPSGAHISRGMHASVPCPFGVEVSKGRQLQPTPSTQLDPRLDCRHVRARVGHSGWDCARCPWPRQKDTVHHKIQRWYGKEDFEALEADSTHGRTELARTAYLIHVAVWAGTYSRSDDLLQLAIIRCIFHRRLLASYDIIRLLPDYL